MAPESKYDVRDRQETTCKHRNCPREKVNGVACEKQNPVFKYKLDETDNANKYFLVTGPIYLAKSSINVTQEATPQQIESHHNLEDEEELLSVINLEPEKEINAYEMWKKCCKEGICSIKELLYVCEKDPDSIMAACRKSWAKDKKVPALAHLEDIRNESLSQIKLTHGEAVGDAKYHFLMVDAKTSMTIIGPVEGPVSSLVSVLKRPHRPIEDEESIPPELDESLPLKLETVSISSLKQEQNTSITWSEDVIDVTKKEVDKKRTSTVVWSGISPSTPSCSESESVLARSSTLDNLAADVADANADHFRRNVALKKNNSLLGIIIEQEIKRPRLRRKSIIDQDISKDTTEATKPKSTRCCGLIKIKENKKPHRRNSSNQGTSDEEEAGSSQSDSCSEESITSSLQSSSTPHNSRSTLVSKTNDDKNIRYTENII